MKMKQFIEYANEENILATFYDKTTGTEVGNWTFGKRYHWWILYILAFISIIMRYL